MLACHFMGFSISSMLGFGVVAWVPTFFIRVHGWAAQDIGYAPGQEARVTWDPKGCHLFEL